ncbi:MAG TPA: NAD(P)H-hydrate epimerase [Planctomycetaceae bacterium]|nr:NAD(P)H-hydrate epimerase [Planctomycetaceae bacterium]
MDALTREQSRLVDRIAVEEFGFHSLVLMENAGRGCADLLERLGIDGPVFLCCGPGNNGGDGFVIARHLYNRGYDVRVRLFAPKERLAGDALANEHILECCGMIPTVVLEPPWLPEVFPAKSRIVDCLLGTGAVGEPRFPLDAVIEAVNAARKQDVAVLSVDLPSGLDADTGLASGSTVMADHTATFVAPKTGFAARRADPFLGRVHVVDIGIPACIAGLARSR